MDRTSCSAVSRHTLHCALELSKKSWLLAIQFPDREQPSVYPIGGGDTEKLTAKLTAARDRWAKVTGALPMMTLCARGRARRHAAPMGSDPPLPGGSKRRQVLAAGGATRQDRHAPCSSILLVYPLMLIVRNPRHLAVEHCFEGDCTKLGTHRCA